VIRRYRLGTWLTIVPVVLMVVVCCDVLISAAIRQAQRQRDVRRMIEAETGQEPYRGTAWGRALWEETASYVEQWSPYYVYRVGDMHGRFINVTDGVRATHQSAASGLARHLVMVFGGSAAWGHGVADADTLPSWLARLAEAAGEPLDVRNYAESGWVNWQGIVFLLERLADGERPDVVVFYSGVNETLSGLQWPDVRRPIFDAEMVPAAMRDWLAAKDRPLRRAWDYYRDTSMTLSVLLPRASASSLPSRSSGGDAADPVSRLAREYLSDRDLVSALGRQFGFTTVFVWQTTVADKPVMSRQERGYAGWLPLAPGDAGPELEWWRLDGELRTVYDRVGREVRSHGVVDVSRAFDGVSSTAFIDWMHPSGAGNEHIARALLGTIMSALRERR
jgi:hypothetical protein